MHASLLELNWLTRDFGLLVTLNRHRTSTSAPLAVTEQQTVWQHKDPPHPRSRMPAPQHQTCHPCSTTAAGAQHNLRTPQTPTSLTASFLQPPTMRFERVGKCDRRRHVWYGAHCSAAASQACTASRPAFRAACPSAYASSSSRARFAVCILSSSSLYRSPCWDVAPLFLQPVSATDATDICV